MGAVVSRKNSNLFVNGPNIWVRAGSCLECTVYLLVREFPEC